MDRVRNLFLVVKRNEALTLSIILALAILIIRYPNVAEWNLGDNDNFMRLHQIKTFIDMPSWYLHPLKDFNPQDGQIIHWSRIPDLPILAVYYVTYLFLDETTAIQIAITIVPLIYLILLSLVLCKISESTFELNQPELATTYTFFSVASLKFLPGHIDHHNLQILLFSVFILLTFSSFYHRKINLFGSALSITLSLLIGLETLPFYILTLGLLTLYSLYNDLRKLTYIKNLSFLVFIYGIIGILILEPIENIFIQIYDKLTIEHLFYFLGAGIALQLSLYKPKLSMLSLLSLLSIGIIYSIFPEAIRPPFHDYPKTLTKYWLNHVTEAQPLLTKITSNENIATKWLYIGTIFPAILSIFLLNEKKHKIYYLVFCISLIPAFFWQTRTILFSSALSIPLQVFVGLKIFNNIQTPVVRIIIPLLIAPVILAGLLNYISSISDKDNTFKKDRTNIIEVINNLKIENKKIFAAMDDGADILALTSNSIISAPYHRNIRGNLLFIETLLSDDEDNTLKNLIENKVDIFIFNKNENQNKFILKGASENSLINKLISGNPPKWLIPMIENKDGFSVYELKR
ncbi:hypothetical protein [Vibrio diazotrophicus]|uniref:hypothetical protein n=1 Tax=Vibrio diazotrophicus TaxID=685 RepID=UPI0005AA0867|nr:hypothetical protein [Vibrio diazotrophicus]